MNHRLQCQCGALRGQLSHTHLGIRGVCYCQDCRAYAAHLGQLAWMHDAAGGAEFVATRAEHVAFESGTQHLACMSLSDRGLLRWYAACCNTPIANTTRNWKFPYVGLIHTCMKADAASFERAFPTVQMRVNTASAKQQPPAARWQTAMALTRLFPRLFASRVSGAYRRTPFFVPPTGAPRAAVYVLSKAERVRASDA